MLVTGVPQFICPLVVACFTFNMIWTLINLIEMLHCILWHWRHFGIVPRRSAQDSQHLTKVLHEVQCRAGASKMSDVGLILTALTSWTRCCVQIWKMIAGTCRNGQFSECASTWNVDVPLALTCRHEKKKLLLKKFGLYRCKGFTITKPAYPWLISLATSTKSSA